MIKYKDNGVEWIGQIPEDWSVIRLKDKYQSIKEIVGEKANEFERLALTLQGVIKRDKYDENGLQPEKFDGYQIIRKNDFVFKMIDLQNISTSRVGLVPFDGIVSPAYLRFRPRNKQKNKFLYYYLLSLWQNEVFNSLGGDGVRSSLTAENMGILSCPFPKYETQQKIVNILDKKCAQIDELIKLQEQEITKLKEYKQSVISEVVTKGLDKNAKMKDSEIPWIGQIPRDWNLRRLKNFGWFTSGISNKKPEDFGFGYPFVNYKNIYSHYEIDMNCEEKVNSTIEDREKYNIKYGDLFFTGSSETVGELGFSCVAMADFPNAVWNGFCIRMRPYNFVNYNPKYFVYLTRSSIGRTYLDANDNSITRANLSQPRLARMPIVIPPIKEQNLAVKFLDKKCKEIDKLISLKNKKIYSLQNYKKSLIYEYVTGKKEIK